MIGIDGSQTKYRAGDTQNNQYHNEIYPSGEFSEADVQVGQSEALYESLEPGTAAAFVFISQTAALRRVRLIVVHQILHDHARHDQTQTADKRARHHDVGDQAEIRTAVPVKDIHDHQKRKYEQRAQRNNDSEQTKTVP